MKPPSPRTAFFSEHPPPPPEAERSAQRKQKRRSIKPGKPEAGHATAEAEGKPVTGALVWCEPPPARAGKREDAEFFAKMSMLKANPGRWALVGNYAGTGSAVVIWKRRGFEAVARVTGLKRCDVYARWPEQKP